MALDSKSNQIDDLANLNSIIEFFPSSEANLGIFSTKFFFQNIHLLVSSTEFIGKLRLNSQFSTPGGRWRAAGGGRRAAGGGWRGAGGGISRI